ncbi:MAG: hypothetical protein Q4F55_03835 [Bacillota bacterium]|nr:hypothetical protein [Bacillota bacterium]
MKDRTIVTFAVNDIEVYSTHAKAFVGFANPGIGDLLMAHWQ